MCEPTGALPMERHIPIGGIVEPNSRRRRASQAPGAQPSKFPRSLVVHSYIDHANDPFGTGPSTGTEPARRGVATAFPHKLFAMLTASPVEGFGDIVSWQPHGRSFLIHKKTEFISQIMPRYVRVGKKAMLAFRNRTPVLQFLWIHGSVVYPGSSTRRNLLPSSVS